MDTKTRSYPSIVTGLHENRSYPTEKGDPILGTRALAVRRTQFIVTGKPPVADIAIIQNSEEIKGYDRLDWGGQYSNNLRLIYRIHCIEYFSLKYK